MWWVQPRLALLCILISFPVCWGVPRPQVQDDDKAKEPEKKPPVGGSGSTPGNTSSSILDQWELVNHMNVSGILPVLKYRSKRTGLVVIFAQAESPIVNGYFCLTTEARTNDGLPHTLEHLVFLGSEDYPYKEVLDLMANRCLASRTNAWTDTDHTCYTVYTAGSDGFLNIVPVYMDHILHPTLREQDFLTEVHHISGDGDDAGVVYSEMQGVENSPNNILYFATAKELYPGLSSYEIQTGGVLKNLRESTTIEKVRDYHRKYYQPKNLQLIITGIIEPEDIFRALDGVEKKILSKDPYPELERPFQTDYPHLTENVDKKIEYPSDEEESGKVAFAWRLPYKLVENIRQLHALKIMGSYLTSTSISPMKKAFVDTPDPYGTDVDFDVYFNKDPAVSVDFENVPIEKMELVEQKFWDTLNTILKDGPDKLDMERLRTLIRRKELSRTVKLENSPHLLVPTPAINAMLYGTSEEHLADFMNEGERNQTEYFLDQPGEFWLKMMNETFSGPRVAILAYPSQKLGLELEQNETARLEKQREDLGEQGLIEAGKKVSDAVASQILPSREVLESVPVADVTKIKYRTLEYYNYTTENQPKGFPLRDIPFKFHIDHIKSSFVKTYFFIDLQNVTDEDRPYMVLLTESWLQSPLKLDGQLVALEDVIGRRSENAISLFNDLGYRGSTFTPGAQSSMMMFYLETLMEKYEDGITLLRDSLLQVEFTEDRLLSLVNQILNGIPSIKLKASTMNDVIFDNIYFNNHSMIHHASVLRQQKFAEKILAELQSNSSQVIKKLFDLKKQLVQPRNVFVYMATNIDTLTETYGEKAIEPWIDFFEKDDFEFPSKDEIEAGPNFPSEWTYADPNPQLRHAITGIPGTESCYLKQGVDYPIRDWEQDEIAAVRVMLQYLTDQMYNLIRGKGLVYSISLSASVTEGRLRVKFHRSSQLIGAYKVFREIIGNYSTKDAPWDPTVMESAVGSEIYSWAEREETVSELSQVSIKSILRNAGDPYYNRRFVTKIAAVTVDDVRKVAEKYLPDFLDPDKSHTSVVCGPSDVESVTEDFKKYKLDLHVIDDIENSFVSD